VEHAQTVLGTDNVAFKITLLSSSSVVGRRVLKTLLTNST